MLDATTKKTLRNNLVSQGFHQSERQDLNLRPLRPERSALARLSYAPMGLGKLGCQWFHEADFDEPVFMKSLAIEAIRREGMSPSNLDTTLETNPIKSSAY